MHAELGVEASNVRAHRRIADTQPVRDLAARATLGHEAQHLTLSDGEAVALDPELAIAAEKRGDHRRRDQRSSISHLPHGVDEVGRSARLVDERAGPSLDRRDPSGDAVVAGQENEPHLRPDPTNGERRVQARPVREMEVHHHQVRIPVVDQADRFGHGAPVAANLHVGLAVEKHPEAVRHELMVVDDEHLDRARPLGDRARRGAQASSARRR